MPIPLEAAVKNFWKLHFVDRVLTILWAGYVQDIVSLLERAELGAQDD